MYRERRAALPLAVLWHRSVGTTPTRTRILPDGCLDLIWDGRQVIVAGPDPTARWHDSPASATYVGLRLFGGLGAAVAGLPALEVLGRSVPLEQMWPDRAARLLQEQVAEDPATALQEAARTRLGNLDRRAPHVLALARAGVSAAGIADQLGLSPRHLHRCAVAAFGYGPARLIRVLRLQRTLHLAGLGRPLATVAADAGYADQAHLSRDVRALTGTAPSRLLAESGS